MKHEMKKIGNIVDEITTYFLEQNAKELNIKVNTSDEKIEILVTAKQMSNTSGIAENLKKYLSYPRAYEMEEYYWELAGENEKEGLAIVGSMVDEAMLDHNDERLYLKVIRLRHKASSSKKKGN
ncbi:MAG: hypothetical protein BEN19_08720 [Epulopiscium sp. Nuni2H_MBin003]|nr:MAG: hypothetical protein BEN19_08720 [Epulopiscium sp. Nuni2H_MBin003]